MKIHVLSDLHIEFHGFAAPRTDADVVVLAGDIGNGLEGVEWAADQFPDVPVIYVPGNHEYYEHDISLLEDLINRSAPNVHVLNDASIEVNGVRFLGSTLWTDFRLYGDAQECSSRQVAARSIKDFVLIKNYGRTFTPEDSVELHQASRAWLESELEKQFAGPNVVVTHHLPAKMSVAERFANNPINPTFASRLEDLIERYAPALWIHGHTHEPCDYTLFNTRVVCNPRGYPREAGATGFQDDLLVDLD